MIKNSKPFPISTYNDDCPEYKSIFSRHRHMVNNYPPHIHDYFEIEIVMSGKAEELLNGIPIHLERGSAHILSTTDVHDLTIIEPLDMYKFMINPNKNEHDIISSIIDNIGAVKFCEEELDEISVIADLLINEYENLRKNDNEIIYNLLHCLVILFSRKDKTDTQINNKINNQYIKAAVNYIMLNYTNNISSVDIAKHIDINPSYCSTLFKQITDTTVTEFITNMRLNRAFAMLRMGVSSVSQICYECGFNSPSNFLRAYKHKYGVSPYETKKSANSTD